MMIDDQPVGPVQPRLKGQIANPCRRFARFALAPRMIMVSFQRHLHVEEFLRQALEQNPGHQSVQIALVREDDLRSEEHTSELQSQSNLVCRLLLEKKK